MNINQYLAANEQKFLLFFLVMGFIGITVLLTVGTGEEVKLDEQFTEHLVASAELPLFNIHTVTAEELMTISGIGEVKAALIVEYRDENHPATIKELINVHGIGEKTLENMREYFYVDND